MAKKKIVFFGTPEFAILSLQKLVEQEDVVGVVSLKGSDVWKYSIKEELNLIDYNDPDLLEKLKNLEADLFVVVAFKILPEEIYNMPRFGSINLHPSLLPKYRGAAPINWAIINGEEKTGVTVFKLTSSVDSGLILGQREYYIFPGCTAEYLGYRLSIIGADLLCYVVKWIDIMVGKRQVGEVTKAPKLTRENRLICWCKKAEEVMCHIRGLCPTPAAWTVLGDKEVKILEAAVSDIPSDKPGSVLVKNKELFIGAGDYYVEILSLQLPGKKIITGLDYINGYLKNGK